MVGIDKDKAIYEWAVAGLAAVYPMTFQFLRMSPEWAAIAPIPGGAVVQEYIDGGSRRQYDFALQISATVSDDPDSPTNTDNMLAMRQWQEWIDAQEEAENYPDFGPTCSGYQLINLANMPTMAGRQNDGLAKYQFPARLIYEEAK